MSDGWLQHASEKNGEPYTARRIAFFPAISEQKKLPILIYFAWAFDREGANGLPDDREWVRINECQQALAGAAPGFGAMLIGSLTSDGLHTFYVYCNNAAAAQIKLVGAVPDTDVTESWEITVIEDAAWEQARHLTKLMGKSVPLISRH